MTNPVCLHPVVAVEVMSCAWTIPVCLHPVAEVAEVVAEVVFDPHQEAEEVEVAYDVTTPVCSHPVVAEEVMFCDVTIPACSHPVEAEEGREDFSILVRSVPLEDSMYLVAIWEESGELPLSMSSRAVCLRLGFRLNS